MKITSTSTIEFPKLGIVIEAGKVVDLPEDKEVAAVILASPYIHKVEPGNGKGKQEVEKSSE